MDNLEELRSRKKELDAMRKELHQKYVEIGIEKAVVCIRLTRAAHFVN